MTSRALVLARFLVLALSLMLAGPEPLPAADQVTVRYTAPERFTDLRERCSDQPGAAPAVLDALTGTIREVSAARLPAGFSLEVTVTDVDQAGEFEIWRGPQFCDTRVMRELYPPRMELRFALKDAEGRVVREGQRRLEDQLYLVGAAQAGGDTLRFERNLLREWLRRELPAPQ